MTQQCVKSCQNFLSTKSGIIAMEPCATHCKQSQSDILGIGCIRHHIAIEIRPPWGSNILQSFDAPPRIVDFLKENTKNKSFFSLTGVICPKDLYEESKRWVIQTQLSSDGSYERRYYHLPKKDLERFLFHPDERDTFRINLPSTEDILLCVHGARDRCCGTFGSELLEALKKDSRCSSVRFWGASHLGGHRTAPTMLTLSDMRYWGHLDQETVINILAKNTPFHGVAHHYRGLARLSSIYEQMIERDLLNRYDWQILNKIPASLNSISIHHESDTITSASFSFEGKDHFWTIERVQDVHLFSSCKEAEASPHRQYRIKSRS